jgi:tRNA dimethylallyltransferase
LNRTLHVLTGCTAVGKTEWALAWAEERGAEIVSCDSLLFYRGMDIGTAKPSAADRARVPHHLIDIVEVTDPMDVTRYVALAKRAAGEIAARNRPALVVGGSGFYLKAFFGPVADAVAIPRELRARIAGQLEGDGLPALVAELRLRNPEGLGGLDTENPRRVARALERCVASGKSVRDLEEEFARQPGPFADWQVKLVRRDRDPEELNRRIEARVAAMLSAGLVGEVRALLAAGLRQNPSAARAIGYREVTAMLEGRLSGADLAAEIVKNTRALVKKQRTWFRTQLPPHEVNADFVGVNTSS